MAETKERGLEVTTLGGGCFWCLEAVFDQVRGVEDVVSGYAGGKVAHPSYERVCTGTTGHAEVVQVAFDPSVISYREILDIFFSVHDPTTLNRQGADIGTPVPFCDLHTQRCTAGDCRGGDAGSGRPQGIPGPGCDAGCAAGGFLPSGRLPPGVLRASSGASLLCCGYQSESGKSRNTSRTG